MTYMYPGIIFGFQAVLLLLKYSGALFATGFVLHHFSRFLRSQISSSIGQKSFNIIFGIGIVVHEISHALIALIFMHEILDIKFLDLKAKDGSHGHVISRPRNVSAIFKIWIKIGDLFIGIAPLIVGPAICVALFYFLIPGGKYFIHNPRFTNFPAFSWELLGWFYFTIAVLSQMELSDADLKGTWKGFFWIILCTLIGSMIYFTLRVK